jgi:uncharacterized membrane protein YfcA
MELLSQIGTELHGVAPPMLAGAFAVLVLAGFIKGTLGFGLPLVALSLLSNVIEIHLALALLTMPIVFSNLWLGMQGGDFGGTLHRFWTLILAVGVGIFIGSKLLAGIDSRLLMLIIGVAIIVFTLADRLHAGRGVVIPEHLARRWGVAAGIIGGVMGGLSTAYGPPLIVYLTALHLPKEAYISTVGVIWFCASIFLLAAFSAVHILTPETAVLSALCVVPVFVGMTIGRRVRNRINQVLFRHLTLAALLILAANLLRRALFT